MNTTAISLTIPIETAPLREMSKIRWPKLKHLYLHGRLLASSQSAALRALLPSLHALETLSVQAARSKQLARPRLLAPFPSSSVHGASSSASSSHAPPTPPAILPRLRSLTIAYANPEDAIFSINAELTHLSLRDCPRFYHFLAYGGLRIGAQWGWNMPILNPAQCLSMMRRMPLSRLTRLELVYMVAATQSGNDADLLTYIGEAFPALSYLEIHRYRYQRTERVDHVHIARTLTAVKSLRTVRLNLDFHDDHQAYCGNPDKQKRWHDTFMGQRGPEILAIMEECPLLEHVALLYHGSPSTTWVEFRTARCPGPRVVLEYDPEHVDSEPLMRKQWVRE
uniref:Autophagy-related protein 11 n=1 Tax=Ganoderma boninense TaxID=34458 RepID=A0A5K1K8W1_9APHY|nr:Autophagy-related protein 11 [Ganoderma boninense]